MGHEKYSTEIMPDGTCRVWTNEYRFTFGRVPRKHVALLHREGDTVPQNTRQDCERALAAMAARFAFRRAESSVAKRQKPQDEKKPMFPGVVIAGAVSHAWKNLAGASQE